ncbi:MAG: helix-turn-helix transcriptional regulator [Patescibacteria group bacterium]|nr:helix-turn-helix transcriptional regulator [Patescibacteria group bacterium]
MLRTPRQRKNLCRSCPIARAADLVGDSVSLLIVRDLLMRPQRFTDLELALQGVSSRTICNKLKRLEKSGIVSRAPNSAQYPRVDYRLTKKGRALGPVVRSMGAYGKKYL